MRCNCRFVLAALVLSAFSLHAGAEGAGADLSRYEGFTHPSRELSLESYIDGVLETLHVQPGDRFAAGDVLVSMDDDLQALAVEQARLRAEGTAAIRVAEARVAEAQVELESQRELAQTSSATPRDVRRAEAGLAIAEGELERAREEQQLAVMQHAIERERLTLYTLVAPFDGQVLAVATAQGAEEGAALRQNDPIMHLVKLDPLVAKISLPPAVVERLSAGGRYALAVGARGRSVDARLKRVAAEADRGSQLIEVEFEVDNPDGAIRNGVRFRLRSADEIEEQSAAAQ